jgi:hypothetical protein
MSQRCCEAMARAIATECREHPDRFDSRYAAAQITPLRYPLDFLILR